MLSLFHKFITPGAPLEVRRSSCSHIPDSGCAQVELSKPLRDEVFAVVTPALRSRPEFELRNVFDIVEVPCFGSGCIGELLVYNRSTCCSR